MIEYIKIEMVPWIVNQEKRELRFEVKVFGKPSYKVTRILTPDDIESWSEIYFKEVLHVFLDEVKKERNGKDL